MILMYWQPSDMFSSPKPFPLWLWHTFTLEWILMLLLRIQYCRSNYWTFEDVGTPDLLLLRFGHIQVHGKLQLFSFDDQCLIFISRQSVDCDQAVSTADSCKRNGNLWIKVNKRWTDMSKGKTPASLHLRWSSNVQKFELVTDITSWGAPLYYSNIFTVNLQWPSL